MGNQEKSEDKKLKAEKWNAITIFLASYTNNGFFMNRSKKDAQVGRLFIY